MRVEKLVYVRLNRGSVASIRMSGVYQRSSGLVQRRTTSSNQGADGGNEDREDRLANGEEEEADHDSKETRLTLMEEVLLLGLKDREVFIGL